MKSSVVRCVFFVALIFLLQGFAFTQGADRASALRFVDSRESRLANQTSLERVENLRLLSIAAYEGGDLRKAQRFVLDLKSEVGCLGDTATSITQLALHVGNTIQGLIALDSGSVDESKKYLLASAKSGEGSAILRTFGPNMLLAKRLLDKGEASTVVEYLELCSTFWKKERLAHWKAAIENGSLPDFGKQLSVGISEWKHSR